VSQVAAPVSPADFEAGVEAGQFPRAPEDADGRTLTTGSSRWLGLRCASCKHTFRRGDLVLVGADLASIRHLDPQLRCGSVGRDAGADLASGDQGATDADDFVDGLLDEWPTITEVPVYELTFDGWHVTGPHSGPDSPICRGCGHTFRAGDHVIICPCAGAEDDLRREYCQIAVHRDPARGLSCWDEWAPAGRLKRCPRTLNRVPS
jgi:hypothetical protein